MKKFILQNLGPLRIVLHILVILGVSTSFLWINSLFSIPVDSFTFYYVYGQIILLLIVLVWGIRGWYAHTNTAASILTIVGVLGTFIGIFMGLQEFTTDEMQESISKLLEGLKFAFSTSIVGIGSALLLKGIISPIEQLQKEKDTSDEAIGKLANRLADELKNRFESLKLGDLTKVFKEESRETRKVFSNMQNALTGGQNKTFTQLEELTATISEKQDALRNGVTPLLTTIQDSLTNEEISVLAKLEVLTTVSEKQSELLNGVKEALKPIQDSLTNSEEIGVLAKLEALAEAVPKQSELLKEVKEALKPIQDSLTDTEAGVLKKLGELTTTVSSEHGKLRSEFETFSNNVAESIIKLATNELIAALSNVIKEFNAKINEQFGDNFKQLNEAVGKTVEWQEQYRQQMDELANEFRVASESIEQSRVSMEQIARASSEIAEKSSSIVACAENMEPLLHTLNDQLEAFSDLRQKAENSLPILNENINELTTKFSSTVQNAVNASEKSMQTQREAFSEQSDQLKSVINGLDDFTTQIGEVTQNVLSIVNDLQRSMDLQKDMSSDLMERFVSMQSALERELAGSVNILAGKLAGLSEKFVEDYTPLTDKLREVIMIAEGVRPRNQDFNL